MILDELLEQSNGNAQVEKSKSVEISRNTIRFGQSVYQFRNFTGFEVGEIQKPKFSWMLFFLFIIGGIAAMPLFGAGLILIGIAIYRLYRHVVAPKNYGLSLFFNSGERRIFISNNKGFLSDITKALYRFLEEDRAETINIDLSNKSINVNGDFVGNAVIGEDNLLPGVPPEI